MVACWNCLLESLLKLLFHCTTAVVESVVVCVVSGRFST
jgi:hypothetical protein